MSGPIETLNGNVALPIDGRIGFGIPEIGSDDPAGPVTFFVLVSNTVLSVP